MSWVDKFKGMTILRVANAIRNRPLLSTLMAASALSSVWFIVWLSVFFFSTFKLNIETSKSAFVLVLWLSVIVESIIRYMENQSSTVWFSKPLEKSPVADNQDFSLERVSILCLSGIVFTLICIILFEANGIQFEEPLSFIGQIHEESGFPDKTDKAIDNMLENWMKCMLDAKIIWALIISFMFRVLIYKRNHKTGL